MASHPSDMHLLFILPVFLLAGLSFPFAKKRHGKAGPMKTAIAGLFLLTLALLMEVLWHLHAAEILLTVIGGSILIYAHIQNRKLTQQATVATCS